MKILIRREMVFLSFRCEGLSLFLFDLRSGFIVDSVVYSEGELFKFYLEFFEGGWRSCLYLVVVLVGFECYF